MPIAAKNQRSKFVDRSIAYDQPALPELPKIPQAIKDYNPHLRPYWEQYERELHDFFKGQQTRNQS